LMMSCRSMGNEIGLHFANNDVLVALSL